MTKPKIDDVVWIFYEYQEEAKRIARSSRPGSTDWQPKMRDAVAKLRKRLRLFGLEDKIDWNEEDKS